MAGQKVPFVWTNDDIGLELSMPFGFGGGAQLDRMVEFLDEFGVCGSFFIVPIRWNDGEKDGDADNFTCLKEDDQLVASIKAAQSLGHCFGQHGTTHVHNENGFVDFRLVNTLFGHDYSERMSRSRLYYERYWQVDALVAQYDWGRTAWRDALGNDPEGFRPGGASFCGNMYTALEQLGYMWTSGQCSSLAALTGKVDSLGLSPPARPIWVGGLVEIPIADDFTFNISSDDFDKAVETGWQLWQMCSERGCPFVPVSHWFMLEARDGIGYRIQRELIPRILDTGLAEPMTLADLNEKIRNGDIATAASAETASETPPKWHVWSQRCSP